MNQSNVTELLTLVTQGACNRILWSDLQEKWGGVKKGEGGRKRKEKEGK